MFLLITGGAGSGKSWIAQGFRDEMEQEESTVILDCVAGLLGKKMEDGKVTESVIDEVAEDIRNLRDQTDNLIVVTNEVGQDIPAKGQERRFVEFMGRINQRLAKEADLFVEVVYGIPIVRKHPGR